MADCRGSPPPTVPFFLYATPPPPRKPCAPTSAFPFLREGVQTWPRLQLWGRHKSPEQGPHREGRGPGRLQGSPEIFHCWMGEGSSASGVQRAGVPQGTGQPPAHGDAAPTSAVPRPRPPSSGEALTWSGDPEVLAGRSEALHHESRCLLPPCLPRGPGSSAGCAGTGWWLS